MLLSLARKRPVVRPLFALAVAALIVAAGAWTLTRTSQAGAVAARTTPFKETGHLHKISKNGASFTEHGPAEGTYDGTLTLYLTSTPNGVTFRMKASTQGGTLVGRGSATIESKGKIGKFVGAVTAASTEGTGRFANARGTGLEIRGVFNRETYALAVTLHGELSL